MNHTNSDQVRIVRSHKAALQRLREEDGFCRMPGALDDFLDSFEEPLFTEREELEADNEMAYVDDLPGAEVPE